MTAFIRWSGAVTVCAGLLALVHHVFRAIGNPDVETLLMVNNVLTIIAFVGIYVYQREAGGLWNLLGALLGIAGNVLLLLDNFMLDSTLGGTLYAFGLVFIGIAGLRSGAFPRWVSLFWIFTMLVGLPALLLGEFRLILFTLATLMLSLAFVGAGYVMWSSPEELATQRAA